MIEFLHKRELKLYNTYTTDSLFITLDDNVRGGFKIEKNGDRSHHLTLGFKDLPLLIAHLQKLSGSSPTFG